MARDTYEVRFDEHGHMVIDDLELARKILYLLRSDLGLEIRLRSLDRLPPGEVEPIDWRGSKPQHAPPPRNGTSCPNLMCDCGPLRVVDTIKFKREWKRLAQRPPTSEH